MKLGIVGLPNVGKSTLFNSLTKAGAESANYPFCTIDPNVGVVAVPDKRLDVLGRKNCNNSQKVVPAVIEFVDIAGLVRGASEGEGLGNQFLSHIREVDAIVHVVRCFEDENVAHVEGSGRYPVRDVETINFELIFGGYGRTGIANACSSSEKIRSKAATNNMPLRSSVPGKRVYGASGKRPASARVALKSSARTNRSFCGIRLTC